MKKLYIILACNALLMSGLHAMEEKQTDNMTGTLLLTQEVRKSQEERCEAEARIKAERDKIKYDISRQRELKEKKEAKLALKKELAAKLQANEAARTALHVSSKKKLAAHEKQYQEKFAKTEKAIANELDFVQRQQEEIAAKKAILNAALNEQEVPEKFRISKGWFY